MINIPKEVEKYLIKDEIVDKQFTLKDCNVFASANRIFIKKGNTVRDISFAHISSIESQVKRKQLIIIIGIVLIIGTFYLRQFNTPSWVLEGLGGSAVRLMYGYGGGWFYYILGVVLIIIGFIWKTLSVKVSVAGLYEEQVLLGDKNTLDALLRLVNERRLQEKPIQTQRTNT